MSPPATNSDPAIGLSLPEPRTVEESVTTALRRAIESGLLAPGQALRQTSLATELGVSRIPLRDAFRRLAAEGLVELDGRRSARVPQLSADDISEIFEMRILLETACARHAVIAMTERDRRHVLELAEAMDRSNDDPSAGHRDRMAFYDAFYTCAARPRMRETIMRLRRQVHPYHVLSDTPEAGRAHRRLRDAIASGDPDDAAGTIAAHLAEARDDLLSRMRADSDG